MIARVLATRLSGLLSAPLSALLCGGALLATTTACSSGADGGSLSTSTIARVKAGFAEIGKNPAFSVDVSLSRRDGSGDERTLSCLSIDSDPLHPDGNHLTITNWGPGAALTYLGGCEGGGDGGGDISVEGDYVYTGNGPAPKSAPLCLHAYQRNRLSPRVKQQLAAFRRSQSPQTDKLLEQARRSSGDGTSIVVLTLDPKGTAALAGRTASATLDSVRMTVTFASATSRRIKGVEVSADGGGTSAIYRYQYEILSKKYGGGVDQKCVTGPVGTMTDLQRLKSALGL